MLGSVNPTRMREKERRSVTHSMDWIIPVGIGVLAVLLLLLICWRRVPADKAMVITGLRKRVLVGRGGFVIPILETSCMISLEAVSMTTDITEAPSKQGIFVDIAGTAVVKVDNQHDAVLTAVEQFCNGNTVQTTQNIKTVVEQILEGKLRGIVSTLTVEQINEDRVAFENSIEDSITKELAGMGLKLLSYTVLKIATQGGYLENRAIPQIAQSKADADIASAERKRDTEVKTAEATREGEKAKLNAAAEIAEGHSAAHEHTLCRYGKSPAGVENSGGAVTSRVQYAVCVKPHDIIARAVAVV